MVAIVGRAAIVKTKPLFCCWLIVISSVFATVAFVAFVAVVSVVTFVAVVAVAFVAVG